MTAELGESAAGQDQIASAADISAQGCRGRIGPSITGYDGPTALFPKRGSLNAVRAAALATEIRTFDLGLNELSSKTGVPSKESFLPASACTCFRLARVRYPRSSKHHIAMYPG